MSIPETEADDLPLLWPRRGMRAFIETRPFGGAWLARRADERMYRMIKGFRAAGDLLIAECKAEPERAQNLIYPALFAYRQAMELRLKSILIEFGEKPKFSTHDLVDLWARCRRVIGRFESQLSAQDFETIEAAEAQIAEFDAVDPGSDAFRFVHDTRGDLIKLKLSEIDIDSLRRAMGSLLEFLNCVVCHLHYLQEASAGSPQLSFDT
jgi:hypothetical protein